MFVSSLIERTDKASASVTDDRSIDHKEACVEIADVFKSMMETMHIDFDDTGWNYSYSYNGEENSYPGNVVAVMSETGEFLLIPQDGPLSDDLTPITRHVLMTIATRRRKYLYRMLKTVVVKDVQTETDVFLKDIGAM